MTVQGGMGVVAQINTGSLTTIVSLLDIDFPELMMFIKESTGHDAAGGWYQATASGKRRAQPFPMRLGWDTAQATHAQIVTSFDAGTEVGFSIADPDGDEVLGFQVLIEKIKRMSEQEGIYEADITVHPTGAVTIT